MIATQRKLRRMPLGAPDALEPDFGELYRRAQTAGYAYAAVALKDQKKISLRHALTKLCIEPFEPLGVASYMAAQVRRKTSWRTRLFDLSRFLSPTEGRFSRGNEWIALMSAISLIFFAGAVMDACFEAVFWYLGLFASNAVLFWTLGIMTAAMPGAMICALAFCFRRTDSVARPRWARIPIAQYAMAVPEFALQTLVDIKEACPEAEIFVYQMEIVREEHRYAERTPIDDPFLAAAIGDQVYYLEVWNEPKFVQERVH